jgi:hypothetical protein
MEIGDKRKVRRQCRGVTVPQRESNAANSAKAKGIDNPFLTEALTGGKTDSQPSSIFFGLEKMGG